MKRVFFSLFFAVVMIASANAQSFVGPINDQPGMSEQLPCPCPPCPEVKPAPKKSYSATVQKTPASTSSESTNMSNNSITIIVGNMDDEISDTGENGGSDYWSQHPLQPGYGYGDGRDRSMSPTLPNNPGFSPYDPPIVNYPVDPGNSYGGSHGPNFWQKMNESPLFNAIAYWMMPLALFAFFAFWLFLLGKKWWDESKAPSSGSKGVVSDPKAPITPKSEDRERSTITANNLMQQAMNTAKETGGTVTQYPDGGTKVQFTGKNPAEVNPELRDQTVATQDAK